MYLISGILTSVIFITLVVDIFTGGRNFFQIKFKEVFYLVGWLLLSVTLLYEYSKSIKH